MENQINKRLGDILDFDKFGRPILVDLLRSYCRQYFLGGDEQHYLAFDSIVDNAKSEVWVRDGGDDVINDVKMKLYF